MSATPQPVPSSTMNDEPNTPPQGAVMAVPQGGNEPNSPPPGATMGPPPKSGWAPVNQAAGTVLGFGKNVLHGVGEAASQSGAGLTAPLAGIETAPGVHPFAPVHGALEEGGKNRGTTGEAIGQAVENIGEFISGEEGLKGVAGLMHVSSRFPELLNLIEKYPKSARILMNTFMGGAQGAVKGKGAGGSAAEGAEAGAAGAGAGSAAAELTGPAATGIARRFGLGGFSSLESMVKAGRAYVGEQNWEQNVRRAVPYLVDRIKNIGVDTTDEFGNAVHGKGIGAIKKVGDFVNLIDQSRRDLWNNVIQPQVDRHANEMIDGTEVAQAVRDKIDSSWAAMPSVFGRQAQAVENFAKDFDNFRYNLKDADKFLHTLNAELDGFYNMSPADRAKVGLTEGMTSALEAGADELRNQIYSRLESAGENLPREVRQDYGALAQMNRVFRKSSTVDSRSKPLNLYQMIGGVAGVAAVVGDLLSTGHLDPKAVAASALPFIVSTAARARQAPASLIRQGLRAAGREAGPGVREAVGELASKTLPAVGRMITGQDNEQLPPVSPGYVRFQASDGSKHDVLESSIEHARQIDPGLHILQ